MDALADIALPNTGQIESNYDETVDSFDEMNLKSELLRGKKCIALDGRGALPQFF